MYKIWFSHSPHTATYLAFTLVSTSSFNTLDSFYLIINAVYLFLYTYLKPGTHMELREEYYN